MKESGEAAAPLVGRQGRVPWRRAPHGIVSKKLDGVAVLIMQDFFDTTNTNKVGGQSLTGCRATAFPLALNGPVFPAGRYPTTYYKYVLRRYLIEGSRLAANSRYFVSLNIKPEVRTFSFLVPHRRFEARYCI